MSQSSVESEYCVLAYAYVESIWVSYLLQELQFLTLPPITLFCDNLSTTYMAVNLVFHARTKHIELDYHFIHERVKLGTHNVFFIPSLDQPADILTKGQYL